MKFIIFLMAPAVMLLSVLFILSGLYITVTSESFQLRELDKLGIGNEFGIDISKYHSDVLSYLNGKSDSMPMDIVLNEKELIHMRDVRNAFSLLSNVFNAILFSSLLLLTIIYIFSGGIKMPAFALMYTGILSLVLALAITLIGFDSVFTNFHLLFFEGDSWLFNPDENIIKIYSIEFFWSMFERSIAFDIVIILSAVIPGILWKENLLKE